MAVDDNNPVSHGKIEHGTEYFIDRVCKVLNYLQRKLQVSFAVKKKKNKPRRKVNDQIGKYAVIILSTRNMEKI